MIPQPNSIINFHLDAAGRNETILKIISYGGLYEMLRKAREKYIFTWWHMLHMICIILWNALNRTFEVSPSFLFEISSRVNFLKCPFFICSKILKCFISPSRIFKNGAFQKKLHMMRFRTEERKRNWKCLNSGHFKNIMHMPSREKYIFDMLFGAFIYPPPVFLISYLSRNRVAGRKRGRRRNGAYRNPIFDFGTPQILRRENSITGEPSQRNGFNSSSYIENLIRRELNSESIRSTRLGSLHYDRDIEDRSFFFYMVVFPLINIAICFLGAYLIMQSYSEFNNEWFRSSENRSYRMILL